MIGGRQCLPSEGDCISIFITICWLINTLSGCILLNLRGKIKRCIALWWELFTSLRASWQKVKSPPGCALWSESSRFNGLLKMGSENWDREVSRLYAISRAEGRMGGKRKYYRAKKKMLTNQTNVCLTRHFHLHSGRWRKAMRGWGEGGGRRSKRERGKSQRKPIKAACISLIFTIAMTFTSCRSRPGKRVTKWGRSEAPGLPHHVAAHIPKSWYNVITGGAGPKAAQRQSICCF